MKERTQKLNVQWTFKRVNRKADGLAQRTKESVLHVQVIFLSLLSKLKTALQEKCGHDLIRRMKETTNGGDTFKVSLRLKTPTHNKSWRALKQGICCDQK